MALTKTDISALRQADYLSVHLNDLGSIVRCVKRAERTEKSPFAQDVEHIIDAPVTLNGGKYSPKMKSIESGSARCYELVNFYRTQRDEATSIIETLRDGDEIEFQFYPDAHSNGYVAKAGLHSDSLYLHVTRKGKRYRWELATSICPNNSARMCRDVPSDDWYYSSATQAA